MGERVKSIKYAVFFLLSVLILSPCSSRTARADTLARDIYREGITGASIRAMGMGGAFIHIGDENPAYFNPAALLGSKDCKMTNNSVFLFSDKFSFGNSSLVRVNENIYFSLSVGNDVDMLGGTRYTVLGGYAVPFGESTTFGFNVKGKVVGVNAGPGFDVGLIGKSTFFTAGIMVQDLFTYVDRAWEPTYIKVGFGMSPFNKPFEYLSINMQGDFIWSLETEEFDFGKMRLGVEYYLFDKLLGLRFGYIYSSLNQFLLTAGAGVDLKYLSINYAYTGSINDYGHWISANFYFWPKTPEEITKTREQELSKKTVTEKTGKLPGTVPGTEAPEARENKDMQIELLNTKLELEKLKVQTLELERSFRESMAELEKMKFYSEEKELENIKLRLPETVSVLKTERGFILRFGCDGAFYQDSAVIKTAFHAVLDKVAEIIKQYPGSGVRVEGYGDASVTDEKNLALTQAKASGIADYLTIKGVGEQRFTLIAGYGSKNPIDTNNTEAGRARNRRIEILIIK